MPGRGRSGVMTIDDVVIRVTVTLGTVVLAEVLPWVARPWFPGRFAP